MMHWVMLNTFLSLYIMFEVFKIVAVNFKLRGGTEKKIKTKQKTNIGIIKL